MSGKWALAMIGVGTLLISGAVTAIAALSRDEGQLRASPPPPPVVSAPALGSGAAAPASAPVGSGAASPGGSP